MRPAALDFVVDMKRNRAGCSNDGPESDLYVVGDCHSIKRNALAFQILCDFFEGLHSKFFRRSPVGNRRLFSGSRSVGHGRVSCNENC